MPELTVLMPVYNTNVQWLSEAIESVLNQTYKDFAFLIIDDGSTSDDVWLCLQKYAKIDSRIKLLKNETNLGLVASLNKGVSQIRTTWIGRMDADDVCELDRFEKQMSYLKEHPDTAVLGTNGKYIETNRAYSRKKIPCNLDEIRATLPFTCCFIHSAIVFNRQKIIQLGGYPNIERAEDYALWLKVLFETNHSLANLPDFLLHIRKGNSAKPAYRRKVFESGKYLREQLVRYLNLKKFPEIWDEKDRDVIKKLDSASQVKEAIINKFPSVNVPLLEKESAKDQLKALKNGHFSGTSAFIAMLKLKVIILFNDFRIFFA